jgi:hypothetical protein
MSVVLYFMGAFAAVVGAVLIGFGIPINEFSFGNTLIIAGAITAVGGLVIIALGVVVSNLRRLHDALATRAPVRSGRPEVFEPAAVSRAAPPPVPFPPKPKFDAGMREPAEPFTSAPMPADDHSYAPTLRNPYESPMTVEDEVSLSPQHPMSTSAPSHAHANFDDEPAEPRQEPKLDADWRAPPPQSESAPTRQPQTAYFDAMWPAEPKPAKNSPVSDAKSYEPKPFEPKFDPPPREFAQAPAMRAEPEAPKPRQGNETRSVAILKSGVVDGMGYTLYVDGSIEAELPQGMLRFASINELRSHLEKNN